MPHRNHIKIIHGNGTIYRTFNLLLNLSEIPTGSFLLQSTIFTDMLDML